MLYKCMLCIFINAIVNRKSPCMRETVSLCLCSFCILLKLDTKTHKSVWKRERAQLGSTIYGARAAYGLSFLEKMTKITPWSIQRKQLRQSAMATTTSKTTTVAAAATTATTTTTTNTKMQLLK